jgi:isopentenyl phosphate kinase
VKPLIFLKLGGSLLTDKTRPNTALPEVLNRVAAEIASAHSRCEARLLLGHGSGSFGHTEGRKYGIRSGVSDSRGWYGFAATARAAAKLNRLVTDALWEAGLPVFSIQPSASAACRDGKLLSMSAEPVSSALRNGLVPLVYGDVAFDSARGGTIVSTEEVFAWLAVRLRPDWILLASDVPGVLERDGNVIAEITPKNWRDLSNAVGGAKGFDVTGGMHAKVESMLQLLEASPSIRGVRIFSGMEPGNVERAICSPSESLGTLVKANR